MTRGVKRSNKTSRQSKKGIGKIRSGTNTLAHFRCVGASEKGEIRRQGINTKADVGNWKKKCTHKFSSSHDVFFHRKSSKKGCGTEWLTQAEPITNTLTILCFYCENFSFLVNEIRRESQPPLRHHTIGITYFHNHPIHVARNCVCICV